MRLRAEERIAAPRRRTRVPGEVNTAAAATDPAAFTDLVKKYDDRLRGLAFRLLGDRDRMDDVLQEAYVKAFRAMPTFHHGADVGTWLYRIVYNVCLDEFRRDRRRRGMTESLAEDVATATVSGGEDQLSDRASLAAAFDSLADDQKAVVWLVDVEGFDYAAAAEVLGIAPGTVGSRLSRAHAALRTVLGEER